MGRARYKAGFQPWRVIRLVSDLGQSSEDGDFIALEEVDLSDDIATIDSKVDLVRGLRALSQADRDLLVDYYWKGETLVTLSKRLGVTDSRVCQKVRLARNRLKQQLVA